MTATDTYYNVVLGTRPTGASDMTERWVTVTHDDGRTIVTGYVGWLEAVSVKVDANPRASRAIVPGIADAVYADLLNPTDA